MTFKQSHSYLALFFLIYVSVSAQQIDPLGNPVFDKSGKELYRLHANFGLLEGNSVLRRDKEFKKKTGNRNFFTFNVEGQNVHHQLTVGNFPTKFSNFTLNKELYDAARWNITFPDTGGRVSMFAGRVTNNTFSISGEHSSPIEDREIPSDNDWFMAGIRAEANLGAYGISIADLPEFTLPLPRVGLSYVNRFFTNYDLTRSHNPLRGVTINNPPTEIFLRFRDASPENDGGAKVFGVKVFMDSTLEYNVTGGRERPGILLPHDSVRDMESRSANSDGFFTYRFFVFNSQDIKNIQFEIDIANDYLVEISTDNKNFQLELSAKGNITDESNRRTRKFHYGVLTDETTLGIDIQTTLQGFSVTAERSWYVNTKQYPILKGKRTSDSVSAWFIDVNRNFGPLTWRSEYTRIAPFYGTTIKGEAVSSFIDDNDDEDPYADSREPEILIVGNTRDDIDGDRIKDWNDDFLLFFANPPKFRLGLNRESIDFNNNGEPDNLEDDDKPNYRLDYDEGSYGHHTYFKLELPFISNLSIIPGYYEKHLTMDKKSASGLYNITSFTPKSIPNFGTIIFRHTLRRSKDMIRDDVVIRTTDQLIKDELTLQNYLGNIFTMIVDYQNVKNLTIRSKFKYQHDMLFHTRPRQRVIDTALINQIRYEYKPRDDLTIAPAFRNDRTIGYVNPFNEGKSIDISRNAYILTLVHQVAEQLQLSAGAQYYTWRNLNDTTQHYNRTVGFFELVLRGNAMGQQIGLLITSDYIIQNFVEPIVGGGERETRIAVSLFLL